MPRRATARSLPSALDLVEEGFRLLLATPARFHVVLFVGNAAMALALVWFIADMSHHPDAPRRAGPAALGLTVLYLACQLGHAVFATELASQLRRAERPAWSVPRLVRLGLLQTAVQSLALPLLPIAALLVLPFPTALAWFQHVAGLGDAASGRFRETAARAWRLSRLEPGGLTGIVLLLGFLAVLAALNIGAAFLAVPLLLKTLLAIESHVSLSLSTALNSTFLSLVIAWTWLILDPLLKATFAVRAFHGDSLTSGANLLLAFPAGPGPRPRHAAPAVLGVFMVAALLCTQTMAATPDANPSAVPSRHSHPVAVSDGELTGALDTVLARPEFAWRLPPRAEPADPDAPEPTWLTRFREFLVRSGRAIRDFMGQILDWLRKQLAGSAPPTPTSNPWLDWLASPYAVLAMAIVATVAALAWFLWNRMGRRRAAPIVAHRVVVTPDIASEDVLASDLPPDDWRRLADDLLGKGEFRLAVRALYLATLAHLGSRSLIAIVRSKSNAEYTAELRRRGRLEDESMAAFLRLVRTFERVWYGSHQASRSEFSEAETDARRLRS